MISYPFSFSKIDGIFIERFNRFVISCYVNGTKELAYLPNPGRLWELLLKDTPLILIKNRERLKIPYTVMACYKDNQPVLLHTHLTNKIVEHLINDKKIKSYLEYKIVQREVPYKKSRFDLLLSNGKKELFLEIKTCTLFGNSIAMFPDAITERGSKHLLDLKEITEDGRKAGILFVIMGENVKYFLPAYHIDLNFSKNLLLVKDYLDINAISLSWDKNFSYVKGVNDVNIPWDFIEKELVDKGSYLLILQLEKDNKIQVGGLEEIYFKKGYYVYIGSALNSLSKRILRHKRKNKKLHWHIDYFIDKSKYIKDIPIIANENLECQISQKVFKIADNYVPDFGSSDCKCISHLYYFKDNPLENRAFQQIITYLRIDRLNLSLY